MRTSPVHYIAPSAISIVPNCNGSPNDLAVTITKETKIKVYSPRAGIDKTGNDEYQEWTLTGRNRRLADSTKPYTIYARLSALDNTAYLIFAPMSPQTGGEYIGAWTQAYSWITTDGLYVFGKGTDWEGQRIKTNCIFVRLGNVSLPDANNKRTVTLDTGILGTDQFNDEWALRPDELPLRIDLGCTIGDEDAGPTPYVYWGQSLVLTAMLTEGWTGTDIKRFDHWEITRNTGNQASDSDWNATDRSSGFGASGQIELTHTRGYQDDFGSAVNALFTITAMGRSNSSSGDNSSEGEGEQEEAVLLVPLISVSINIMAEAIEKYEMSFSASIVSYNPQNRKYNPSSGVAVRFRATDQRGEVFMLTKKQFTDMGLVVKYAVVGSEQAQQLTPSGQDESTATVTVPELAFHSQQSVNVWLKNSSDKELATDTIAFVRDGEDSKEREWIFKRYSGAVTFGTQDNPYPSSISGGEVNPSGAATGNVLDKNQDGWVPESWWDEMRGTTEDNPYEYGAYRDYDKANSQWGAFSQPKIWSHYGKDGENAPYDVLSYGRSKSRTSHAGNNLDTSYGTNGWGSVAPSPTDVYPYIWQRTQHYNAAGTLTTTSYVCLTGDDGKAQYIYLRGTASDENSSVLMTIDDVVSINGGTNKVGNHRGLNLVTIDRQTLTVDAQTNPMCGSYNYDTYGEMVESGTGITDLIAKLNALDNSVFVCLVSYDAIGWSTALITALQDYGLNVPLFTETGRYPFLFIGYKGLGRGNGMMRMRNVGPYTNIVELSVYVANGSLTSKDGEDGEQGKPAVNVVATPSSLIVNQSLLTPNNLSNLSEQVLFSVMEGDTQKSVSKVEVTAVEKDENSSQSQSNQNTQKISVTGSNSYYATVTAINKDSYNQYYDQAYFICKVYYENNSKYVENVKVKVYANLLGTWSEEVKADTKTEIARKLTYGYDPSYDPDDTTQEPLAIETFGQYIKSSEVNISTLTKKVNEGKNLLTGVLTGSGWKMAVVIFSTGNITTANIKVQDTWFMTMGVYNKIKTPTFTVENGRKYTFSFEIEETQQTQGVAVSIRIYRQDNSYETVAAPYTGSRRYCTFTADVSGRLFLLVHTNKLRYAQVETGTEASEFEASSTETSSQVKQTADNYNVTVKNEFKAAGLDITSDKVQLLGGLVEFMGGQNNATKYVSVSLDENYMPHFIFYAQDGTTPMYDLGYTGLTQLINNAVPDKYDAMMILGALISGNLEPYSSTSLTADYINPKSLYYKQDSNNSDSLGEYPVWYFSEGYTINGQGVKIWAHGGTFDGSYLYTRDYEDALSEQPDHSPGWYFIFSEFNQGTGRMKYRVVHINAGHIDAECTAYAEHHTNGSEVWMEDVSGWGYRCWIVSNGTKITDGYTDEVGGNSGNFYYMDLSPLENLLQH